eukprot:CAMPEP_0201741772 /NCGR_PEP_ID=MMETSP0593-20130828/46982_1 /ASSEMBLY_ACC=CAM_ASM_000672 /TAXON_ID=267983 /ORGANISM="Skeletonema japonicum, Strain CCMP2506" /LENGTH=594 /DNA_ID=CAMNT_0048236111 /DNA_START=117 /DNA_END=1902 /DNA_ORIENTATION=+
MRRTSPPSQDRLVMVFITASAIFAIVTFTPFLLGNFPAHDENNQHLEGLINTAENRWERLVNELNKDIVQHDSSDNVILQSNTDDRSMPLARGVAGLPMSQTPALIGAKHGSIQCDNENYDDLAYWNDPQGERDVDFVSPFASSDTSETRYITFEPDRGGWNNIRMALEIVLVFAAAKAGHGWNNIRMALEIVLVFAAATGRTLVLPPNTPFYRLTDQSGKGAKHHGFADFLDLEHPALRNKVKMISMTDFLEREGGGKMFTLPSGQEGKLIKNAADHCFYIAKSNHSCEAIYNFLRKEGFVPELQAGRECLIFDKEHQAAKAEYNDQELFDLLPEEEQDKISKFCRGRKAVFYGSELDTVPLIHFQGGEKEHRLLNHFYTFLYFVDDKVDHYYKRFVRDFMHYGDNIFCTAGKIVRALEEEAAKAGGTSFSAIHVRRGDFQYKKVKITAEDWYENTKDIFTNPKEIIYIATDEKDHTFFDPLRKHYNLRFLDDFKEIASLDEIDPNLFGMIDTVIASRSRLFVGTWFSTFTGYINRMRGYIGMSGTTSYYSTPDRKYNTHKWENPGNIIIAREWPTAWVGIDGDVAVYSETDM